MTSTFLQRQSLKTSVTFITLAIFLVSLWSLSLYASQMLRKDMERLLGEQQFSTVSVVASSVDADLTERVRALELVARAIDSSMLKNPASLQKFLERLIVLQTDFNGGVHAVGRDGVVIADVSGASRVGTSYAGIEAVRIALSEGKTSVGYPIIEPLLKRPVFPVVAAILNADGKVIGALIGSTHLGKSNFLDKISNGRYGKTGGYMLVAPQNRLVVTATDKNRIMEILPAAGINPLSDRFIQGYEGSGVGVNSLGLEVLASAKGVPVAGWYVAAQLPAAEAFAPIQDMQQRMLLATVLLTMLAGVLIWWMIKRQLSPMLAAAKTLATMSDTNLPPQPLPVARQDEIGHLISGFNRLLETLNQRKEALKQSERKLSEILENVDAFIYLKDPQGRYLFANRAMRELFGVSVEGIVGKSDESFFGADTVAQLRRNDRLVFTEGKTLRTDETNLKLSDGRTITTLSVKIPLRHEAGDIYALCGISTDITERKLAEEELRISAIAFECQEGIVVLDANLIVLRVNQAYTKITGYTQKESEGKTTTLLKSDLHPASFYSAIWEETKRTGIWQGEMWQRRKGGELYPARVRMAAVRNEHGVVTRYVGNLTDATNSQLQEQQRLLNEAAQRTLLVREVHHRIKNNLQGITGILRQFAQRHPETAEPIRQAIGQVQGISVIHGLQGRKDASLVRLCELTGAIADGIQNLWQTPVILDIPATWIPCVIAEKEAVPLALVLNELIVNAVKHGGKAHGQVNITLQKCSQPDMVQITITNTGQLSPYGGPTDIRHNGLQLIAALMPRIGAHIVWDQQGDRVITLLEIEYPIISLELKESI